MCIRHRVCTEWLQVLFELNTFGEESLHVRVQLVESVFGAKNPLRSTLDLRGSLSEIVQTVFPVTINGLSNVTH